MSWYQDLSGRDDIDALARECAGNWKHFDSFAWYGQHELDNPENYYLFYTLNRDSSVLEESNAHIIAQELAEYGDDARSEDHSHWAVGWIKGHAVKCLGADGKATPAFRRVVELAEELNDYPVLCDIDYSDREYEEAQRVWKTCFSTADRLQYVRDNYSQFEFRSFADMLAQVRGSYFSGYASELLQP